MLLLLWGVLFAAVCFITRRIEMAKKNWIQGAINPKHKGDCSGKNFGSKKCPVGSRKYNLAKTLKKYAKKWAKKK